MAEGWSQATKLRANLGTGRELGMDEQPDLDVVNPRTFEMYRVTGEGPRYIKRGKKVLYAVEDLESWMCAGLRISTTYSGRAA